VRVSVRVSAPGGRAVVAAGRVTGRAAGVVRVTAYHAARGGSFKPAGRRTAVVRRGRFTARLSRFRHGRWRVRAALRGVPSAVGDRRARLGATVTRPGSAPGKLPPGVADSGLRGLAGHTGASTRRAAPTAVAVAELGAVESPGPLVGGGYLQRSAPADQGTVRFVQHRLSAAGFHVTADGRYGALTEQAVTRFQTAHGLAVDGVVGRQTAGELKRIGGS
jgi:hypothetical protein